MIQFNDDMEPDGVNDVISSKIGIISTKKLDILLTGNKPSPRIKAVMTSKTPTTKLKGESLKSGSKDIMYKAELELMKKEDIKLYYIAKLMQIGALRVSEVLSINPKDISRTGHVVIRSKKGGDNRVIYTGEVSDYLLNCKRLSIIPFRLYDRHYIYREFKKRGIVYESNYSTKKSVAHSIRHSIVDCARREGFEKDSIKRITGHKSDKVVELYGKSKR